MSVSAHPVYYQPLVEARIASTAIGESTLHDLRPQQLNFALGTNEEGHAVAAPMTETAKALDNSAQAPAIGAYFGGVTALQAQLPGSREIKFFQLATSRDGSIANRIDTSLRNHPEMLLTVSPDRAAEVGAQLVQAAQTELESSATMRASGDTLDVGEDATRLLLQHAHHQSSLPEPAAATTPESETAPESEATRGSGIAPEAAAFLTASTLRELQRQVTPQPPDTTSAEHQWIEDAALEVAALWPGAIAHGAHQLQLSDDAEAMEAISEEWRFESSTTGPRAEHVRSIIALLEAAGVDTTSADASSGAFELLQGAPLEQVPNSIAQAIVQQMKLPEEASSYVADRIVETHGQDGNVRGVLSELDLVKRDIEELESALPADESADDESTDEASVAD